MAAYSKRRFAENNLFNHDWNKTMRLAEYFTAVATKRLRPVEADPNTSNQHEFNGISRFREMLGDEQRAFSTNFIYLDDTNEPINSTGQMTWYDARKNDPKRAAEFRLYFPSNEVSERFTQNHIVIIARRADDTLLVICTPYDSTVCEQLLWLFGLDRPNGDYSVRDAKELDRDVDYVVRWVLESIGIEPESPEVDSELLTKRFGNKLPTTRIFSQFAREQAEVCDPNEDPDHALILWLETEERYFRAFERMLVSQRLREGFISDDDEVDVDGFISYSLSVQNRRKSRAGLSLENHLESVLLASNVNFNRGVLTEGKSKPDFLFPGQSEYVNPDFTTAKLSILGAKATCKERWRQVLAEADRIEHKHLVTLEPSISTHQTDQMQGRNLQLVLPSQVIASYTQDQQNWLWSLKDFVEHIRRQQAK